jgi:hypothetical protein
MRPVGGTRGNLRGSALWGKKNGETRGSALWGKPGRGLGAVLLAVLALGAPVTASASAGSNTGALVPDTLLAGAQANPTKRFAVIVQAKPGKSSTFVANLVQGSISRHPGKTQGVKKKFAALKGVAAQLTGAQLLDLAAQKGILTITRDTRVRLTGYSNDQGWVQAAGVSDFWTANGLGGLQPPAIAVVDSGVQRFRSDFDWGARVIKQVSLTSLTPNSPGDGRGHGGRRRADRADRLHRRDGRQRHGDDERRHRGSGLDPAEQDGLQHPCR